MDRIDICLSRMLARLALAGLLALTVLPVASQAQVTAFKQAIAEAAAGNGAIATFYRKRDYAPIWTTEADADRRAAFFAALDSAGAHGLPLARYDTVVLRAKFASVRSERDRGRLEAAMSLAFLAYAQDIHSGVVAPSDVDPGIVREVARRDPVMVLQGFAIAEPAAYLRALPPHAPQYAQLMKAKLDLEAVIERGGWGPKVASGKLEPGDTGDGVVSLRERLIARGYLRRSAQVGYDAAMQRAVQLFQIDHGLTADGVAGEGMIEEINIGPEKRLESVIVAMERLRWMNGTPLGSRHVWVNLPDFTAKIVDDGKVTFVTPTIIGMNLSDRRSPEFSDFMEFMVINPTWNVPRSIAVKEYLPMLQKDPTALGHLRIADRYGRQVDRAATDFNQFTAGTFPFAISQVPSNSNALGLVKFMLPNEHNIYLHDTPTKNLFLREVRAFSHGCIRLARPFDFAYALLARQTADPKGYFEERLVTRRETTVPLDAFVPVHLVYFTAWPTPKGRLGFRRDIYGRDGRIFDALEAVGVSLPVVQG